jgi:hypothetical protein
VQGFLMMCPANIKVFVTESADDAVNQHLSLASDMVSVTVTVAQYCNQDLCW